MSCLVSVFLKEILTQQIAAQIAGIKKDMIILEKSEFAALRAENEVSTLLISLHPSLRFYFISVCFFCFLQRLVS